MEHKLISACKFGNLQQVKFEIENGVYIHTNHEEPLKQALQNENYDVAKYLLQKGAHIDTFNAGEDELIATAYSQDNMKMIKFLVENGLNINYKLEYNIDILCEKGYLDMFIYLCQNGLSIDNGNYDTYLSISCVNNHLEFVKYLTGNVVDKKGESYVDALKICLRETSSSTNNVDIVDYLLLLGVNPKYVFIPFIKEYYSPTTVENIFRLHNLYNKGVDITQLKNLTVEDIISLPEKIKLVEEKLYITTTSIDIVKIITQYL